MLHKAEEEEEVGRRPSSLWETMWSVGQGAGRPEVGEELEAEADHKVPDVPGHLGAGDEHPPDEHQQQRVEGIADIPQPGKEGGRQVNNKHTGKSGTEVILDLEQKFSEYSQQAWPGPMTF